MQDPRRILIIDGDPSFRSNAARFLTERGYDVRGTPNAKQGLDAMREQRPDFVLVDLNLSEPGFDLVDTVIASPERPRVIGVAQTARVPEVVAAIKAGALDVLERPVDGERLCRIMERSERPSVAPASGSGNARPVGLARDPQIDTLVADSDVMRAVLARVERLAGQESTIVLEGEFGSGQEGVARHYHATCPRAGGPFVHVSREGNAEEELFGSADTMSAFARAKGGIVYIESLVALGKSGQDRLAKLLHGLAAARLNGGGVRWPPMIVGIERPIDIEVSAGLVREDLAQLLGRAPIVVPPLRNRREDIPELVYRAVSAIQHAVGAPASEVDPAVMQDLVARDWENNIPELVGVIRRSACFDAHGGVVVDLSVNYEPAPKPRPIVRVPQQPVMAAPKPAPAPVVEAAPPGWHPTLDDEGLVQPYDVYEAEIFRFALKNTGGCVSRAAEMLGVGRATMYRKMRAYDIVVPPVAERSIARSRRARKRRAEAREKQAAARQQHSAPKKTGTDDLVVQSS